MPANARSPIVTVSVQFPDLSTAEFDSVKVALEAAAPGRVVLAHEAHRWYAASSDPETVDLLISALRAVLAGQNLSYDDEEALDDLSQEYADWLEESALIPAQERGPVVAFSTHLPAIDTDEFAALLARLRHDHPRRIILGEQRGHSHHEIADRQQVSARLRAIGSALRGQPIAAVDALALQYLLHDYAGWRSDPTNGVPG